MPVVTLQSAGMMLHEIPEFISITGLLKATPREQDGQRFIFMEVSNEGLDQQGEKVLTQALAESAAIFKAHGNIDIDHATQLRERGGFHDWMSYEIGRPVDVKIDGLRTLVKAQLYQGDTDLARNANLVWESLTQLSPPARWYPSVGGAVLEKAMEFDPDSQAKVAVIKKVRWTNVGLSRTPVNQHVPIAQTVPFGALSKCWLPGGLNFTKALEAGYGTDSAALTGGAALRKQSLDPQIQSYWDFRDRFAADVRRKKVKIQKQNLQPLLDYATRQYRMTPDDAAEYLERFFGDIKRHQTKSATRINP